MKRTPNFNPLVPGWGLFAALLIVVSAGCAVNHSAVQAPPPLSPELRSKLERIGVVSAGARPSFGYQQPQGKSSGAITGATKGFNSGQSLLAGGVLERDPYAGIVLVPLAVASSTFGTIGGLIGGTVKGVPEAQRLEAEAAITNAVRNFKLDDVLRDYFLQAARATRSEREIIFLNGSHFTDSTKRAPARTHPAKGGDAVLELSVLRWQLTGEPAINPPLHLALGVRARLVNASNGAALYTYETNYRSALPRKFTEWADDHARPLQEEIENACHFLAGRIAGQLFLNPSAAKPSMIGNRSTAR